jgi:hypothetical protein
MTIAKGPEQTSESRSDSFDVEKSGLFDDKDGRRDGYCSSDSGTL